MNPPIPVQCSKTNLKGQFCSRSKKIPNATVNVYSREKTNVLLHVEERRLSIIQHEIHARSGGIL